MPFAWKLGTLACAAAVALAMSARAQSVDDATRGTARKIGYDGVSAYQAGDYATAHDRLDKAYRVLRAPSLGLWLARSLVKLGRLVEASERYLEVTRLEVAGGDETIQKQAQADAATELAALTPRIPSVIVAVAGATPSSLKVTFDGVPMAAELVGEARPVDPGRHRIEATRGAEHVVVDVSVEEGEQKSAQLKFATGAGGATPAATTGATPVQKNAPAAESGGGTGTTLGWIALGGAAAGLAVGGISGVIAFGKKQEIDDSPNCTGNHCLPIEQDLADSYMTLRTVSSVGFIAGGVLAATGIVLLITAPSARTPSAALWVSPTSAGMRGRF